MNLLKSIRCRKKRGMTLLEVIISIAILSIIIIPVSNLALTSVKFNKNSGDKQQAVVNAQKTLEELKGVSISDGLNLSNGILLSKVGTSFKGNNLDAKGNGIKVDISPKDDMKFQGPGTGSISVSAGITLDGTDKVKAINKSPQDTIVNKIIYVTFDGSDIRIETGSDASPQLINTYSSVANKNLEVTVASTYTCDNTDVKIINKTSEVANVYVDKKLGATGNVTIVNGQGIVRNHPNYNSDLGSAKGIYNVVVKIYKNNEVIYELQGYKEVGT